MGSRCHATLLHYPLRTAGVQRFKFLKVIQERPVLIAEVELLPEDDDTSQQVHLVDRHYCPAWDQ